MMITKGKFLVAFFLQVAPHETYHLVDPPCKDDPEASVRAFSQALGYDLSGLAPCAAMDHRPFRQGNYPRTKFRVLAVLTVKQQHLLCEK